MGRILRHCHYTYYSFYIPEFNLKSSSSGNTESMVKSENTSGGHLDVANENSPKVFVDPTSASSRFLCSLPMIWYDSEIYMNKLKMHTVSSFVIELKPRRQIQYIC